MYGPRFITLQAMNLFEELKDEYSDRRRELGIGVIDSLKSRIKMEEYSLEVHNRGIRN